MKDSILNNLDNPTTLEKLYRDDKVEFKKSFNEVYNEISDTVAAKFWNERLNYEPVREVEASTSYELWVVIVLSLIAGLFAKLPMYTTFDEFSFYTKNWSFVFIPMLCIYFAWKQKLNTTKLVAIGIAIVVAFAYINITPTNTDSQTYILSCIHLPYFVWAMLGLTYVGNSFTNYQKRIDYLRYNGDLVIITTVILLAGVLLTLLTLGLFTMIDVDITEFYMKNVVIFGIAASPIVGTYLLQKNPELVSRVSPIIAKVFTPLVLITLVVYLLTLLTSDKNPYTDRDFLLLFNIMLIAVIAIILFAIVETSKSIKNNIGTILLVLLSIVTIIVNSVALSAILIRISEWGFTPNRLAVMGGNVLFLINLILITYWLIKSIKNSENIVNVQKSIANYLPIYTAWTVLVTFIFPLIFSFINYK